MSTVTVAQQLVDFCQQGQYMQAVETLYADDIVSVEAADCENDPSGMPREMQGLQAIRGKNQWWTDNHEVHSTNVQGPHLHGEDRFAVIFDIDVTHKPSNQRMQMQEVGVYTVANDKIVREEFFYTMPSE